MTRWVLISNRVNANNNHKIGDERQENKNIWTERKNGN